MASQLDNIHLPLQYLKDNHFLKPHENVDHLEDYQAWWRSEGIDISRTVDQHGTPWLKMFDKQGKRVDQIMYPSEYWKMLAKGYDDGIIWRSFDEQSLYSFFRMGYICAFYDGGILCPYTVSMSTAAPIHKYMENTSLREHYLDKLTRKEDPWQGATWFTEIKGGSDLGNNTQTIATRAGEKWLLNGSKYFSSNVGADLAVISARPEGAEEGLKGLQLFVMPKYREDGSLNYKIRRLKDKIGTRSVPTGELELDNAEAYILNENVPGIYAIMEVLNISRVSNAMGSVALAQRAISEAYDFARNRVAFGKPVIEQPLLEQEFKGKMRELEKASHLAFRAAELLDQVYSETPKYSEDYHYFRFVAHLAKFWTAELAVRNSKWAMEVHGGIGILEEFGVERLQREAMILPIWEGTPHRQMLDGWEVMVKHNLHERLFDEIRPHIAKREADSMYKLINNTIKERQDTQERRLTNVFKKLAMLAAKGFMLQDKSKVKENVAEKQ